MPGLHRCLSVRSNVRTIGPGIGCLTRVLRKDIGHRRVLFLGYTGTFAILTLITFFNIGLKVPRVIETHARHLHGLAFGQFNEAVRPLPLNISENTKIIYFYNPQDFHVFEEWVYDTWGTSKKFDACRISNCVVATGHVPMKRIDAIIFKPRDMRDCPKEKVPGQVWIFVEFESPCNYFYKECFYELQNKVNWTMTYRRDADFPIAHGYFRKINDLAYKPMDMDAIYSKKIKSAIALISNCGAKSKRERLIQKLQSHGVSIDVFGLCGNRKLNCEDTERYSYSFNVSGTLAPETCFAKALEKYKFFLSFENSICVDYTTEKSLHRVMQHPIIPVIMDGSNSSLFHPPHSYIHTSDFRTTKALADHIKLLDRNKTAYLEYFKWKRYYYTEDVRREWNSAFCKICERLHKPENHRRLYKDIAAWHMTPGGKQACTEANDFN